MDQVIAIALGANLDGPAGSPADSLRAALREIDATEGCRVVSVSRFFRSPAYPPGAGPDYINAAATLDCALPPEGLLDVLHKVERRHGRTRETRWGARVLDLDLLTFGQAVLPSELTLRQWRDLPPEAQQEHAPDELILPHPRLQDRAFVLVPLVEVAPDWHHPLTGESVRQMLDALPESDVRALTPVG